MAVSGRDRDSHFHSQSVQYFFIITGYGHSTNRPGHHGTVVAPDGWEQCFLSHTLPRERYPPGRHWRVRSLSIWVKCSQLVAVYDGVLTLDVTAIQISTCSRKLSIKAVFMEMTTRKWYNFSLGSIRYSGVQLNIGVLACS